MTSMCARVAFAAPLVLLAGAAIAQSLPSGSPDARPPVFRPPSKQLPPRAAPDMQAVLNGLGKLGARPIHSLTPAQARAQPSPADAVAVVLRQRGLSSAPDPSVVTRELAYGPEAEQRVRIYTPAGRTRGLLPMLVYYHGGGWVIANLDVYDSTPRMLAKKLNAMVVSVEYRHAPEFKFPAQHDDAVTAYRYTLDNAAKWGGDARRIAFVGESAGGNLAINTALAARDQQLPMPRHIVSVYPIANTSMTLPSRRTAANAKPLSTPDLPWFGHYYTRTPADLQDPRINLVKADLHGLPPVTIVSAQIDPLLSDGLTLTTALRRAGVSVEQRTFPGVTHEFFGMGAVVSGAAMANDYAVARLRPVLDQR